MRSARRRILAPVPTSLRKLARNFEDNILYRCHDKTIFRTILVDDSIVFGCRRLVQDVLNYGVEEVHMDGTFKVLPSTPAARQLFILHATVT